MMVSTLLGNSSRVRGEGLRFLQLKCSAGTFCLVVSLVCADTELISMALARSVIAKLSLTSSHRVVDH